MRLLRERVRLTKWSIIKETGSLGGGWGTGMTVRSSSRTFAILGEGAGEAVPVASQLVQGLPGSGRDIGHRQVAKAQSLGHGQGVVVIVLVVTKGDARFELGNRFGVEADQVRLSYALRGAKDNPEMDAFHSRFKTEGHSLFLDAQGVAELAAVVDGRIRYNNTEQRHSAIGCLLPLTYIERVWSGFE